MNSPEAGGAAQDAATNDAEACHWLALAGGGAAVVVGALFFRGWIVSGHRVDAVPALVAAIVTGMAIRLLGRIEGTAYVVYAGGFALLALAAGYSLAWDLFGLVAAQSGDAAANAGWLGRLHWAWSSRTGAERFMNGLSYVLSPCLAMTAMPLWQRLGRADRRDRAGPGNQFAQPDPVPVSVTPRPRCRLVCGAWSLGVLCLSLLYGGGERSGFTRLSFPCEEFHATYPLTGFNYLRQGAPIMAEEVPALEQVDWFSGAVRSDNNFRFLRAGYAFLAVQAAPWFGRDAALLVVNVSSWCACVASVWVLCRHMFRDESAAAIAVCLAATGIGLAIHLHSFGPHLTGFALYFCGVTWLAVSGVAVGARPWRWHCTLGLGLGLIGIVYNVGPMLVAVYLWNGLFRQRWLHLLGGAALALSVRPVWRFILPALGINVEDTEAAYASAALHVWAEWWETGVITFLWHAARLAIESVTACDSPAVLVLGLLAVFMAPRSWRSSGFGVPVLGAPVLASTLFAPAAEVRGYIVFGMTVWLYCCIGGWLARGLQHHGVAKVVTSAVLGLALAGQMVWSTAHYRGWLGPAKTYFLGWDDGWPVLRHEQTRVISLTGEEPTPVTFGGSATLADAGALDAPLTGPVLRRSRVLAWLSRLPLIFGLLMFGSASVSSRAARRRVAALAAGLLVIGGESSFRTPETVLLPFEPSHGAAIAPHRTASLRIRVATTGLSEMRDRFRSGQYRLGLFLQSSAPIQLILRAGGRHVPLEATGPGFHELTDRGRALAALDQPDWELTVQTIDDQPVWLSGWQRLSLPAREWSGALSGAALPGLELRLVRVDDGFLEAAAF